MKPHIVICALLSLALSPGCALINSQSEAPNAPASDMAADLSVADMAADLDAADLPDDMPQDQGGADMADMAEDLPDDMPGDMDMGPSEGHASLADCQQSADAMFGMTCYERGGTCAQVQRSPARYVCLTGAQLDACVSRTTLAGARTPGAMALTTDATGELHAFAVDNADARVWQHFAGIKDKTGELMASARRSASGDVLALTAVAAPAPDNTKQVAIALSAFDGDTPRLSMSAWRGNSSYEHTLANTRPAAAATTSGTITDELCSPSSPLRLRQAPTVVGMDANVLLTGCFKGTGGGPLAATTPVRVPGGGSGATWGEAYAFSNYTLEDEGSGVFGPNGLHIRLLSIDDNPAFAVRSAKWTDSNFSTGGRAMSSGTIVSFGDAQKDWFASRCQGDKESPSLSEQHMILPHPTDPTRAMVFVRTGEHVRVIEWDDDTVATDTPVILCGTERTQDARWRDRIDVGGSRWMAVGTTSMGHIAVMSATWRQEEAYEHRMIAQGLLDARALATDGTRVWLLGTRRELSSAAFVLELTPEGAPVCAP
jgi:hypothetical protein